VSSLSLTVVPQSGFAESVTSFAKSKSAELIVLPWNIIQSTPSDSNDGDIKPSTASYNPLQYIFGLTHAASGDESVQYSHFIRQVFSSALSDVALLVEREREESGTPGPGHHLVVPFFGGPDDRLAMEVAVGLAKQNRNAISATIVRITRVEEDATSVSEKGQPLENPTTASAPLHGFPDTVYGQPTTETRMISRTADEIAWSKLATEQRDSPSSNVTLIELQSPRPLHAMIEKISELSSPSRNVLAVVGRSRQMAVETHRVEISQLSTGLQGYSLGSAGLLRKTVGDVGATVVATTGHQVLVLQAKRTASELNES